MENAAASTCTEKRDCYFLDSKQQDSFHFQNAEWLVNLAFLVDITTHMNNLNKELVGKNKLVFDMFNCITAFERKLQLWEVQFQNGNCSHFPNLQKQEIEIKPDNFASAIQDLRQEFSSRFVDFRHYANAFKLFGTPFQTNVEEVEGKYQLELTNLQ